MPGLRWFALMLALQVGSLLVLRKPRMTVHVVHTASVEIVALPIALPIEHRVNVPVARPSCPPPRRDAHAARVAALPAIVSELRPSPSNAGWIAAWNEHEIFISTDAGASWQPRLRGDGVVQDVAFDCFGRVLAIRDNQLGIDDGKTTWHPSPMHGVARLVGGGPDIVVVAGEVETQAALFVSGDLGETFQRANLEFWAGYVHGRQHEDGTVQITTTYTDCSFEQTLVFLWRKGVLERIEPVIAGNLVFVKDRMYSSGGWQRIGSETQHEISGVIEWGPLIDGPYPIQVAGTSAWRVDGKRAVKLPWVMDPQDSEVVADAAGRIWSIHCGHPRLATRTAPERCQGAGDSR